MSPPTTLLVIESGKESVKCPIDMASPTRPLMILSHCESDCRGLNPRIFTVSPLKAQYRPGVKPKKNMVVDVSLANI